jgi:hypothetical protein
VTATERLRRYGALSLLAVIAVLALAQSWNRWLDPVIDTGRDLYVSEQLSHGTKLYRDLRYQYPPLAPYLLGAITGVAGSSLATFTAIGIAQSIAIAALLWLAVPRWGGPVAALFFLCLSFTGASTWGANFIFPYAYAATIGMAFLLGALVALLRNRPGAAIALLTLASWCKVEYAIAAAFVMFVLLVARRLKPVMVAAYAAAMGVTVVLAYAVFGPPLVENLFSTALTKGEIAQHFFSNVSGSAEWRVNVVLAVAAALAIASIALLIYRWPMLGGVVAIAAALVLTSESFFRGWGALQYVALVLGFRNRQSPLLYYAAFSIATTMRVPLNTTPEWYGFALVVPLYALAAYVLFVDLPERGVAARWWIAIIAAICIRDLWQQHERYALKQFAIHTPRGTLYDVNPDRAAVIADLLAALSGETLVVLPEGVSINYLSGRPTPLTYYMFTPPETAAAPVEQAVMGEFKARPPDEVVILSRDVSEYGFRGFGVDYNVALSDYLKQDYKLKRLWRLPRFQAALLTR